MSRAFSFKDVYENATWLDTEGITFHSERPNATLTKWGFRRSRGAWVYKYCLPGYHRPLFRRGGRIEWMDSVRNLVLLSSHSEPPSFDDWKGDKCYYVEFEEKFMEKGDCPFEVVINCIWEKKKDLLVGSGFTEDDKGMWIDELRLFPSFDDFKNYLVSPEGSEHWMHHNPLRPFLKYFIQQEVLTWDDQNRFRNNDFSVTEVYPLVTRSGTECTITLKGNFGNNQILVRIGDHSCRVIDYKNAELTTAVPSLPPGLYFIQILWKTKENFCWNELIHNRQFLSLYK
eukprot:TRINITY_DN907_c0_g1_i1.p1 TRINITY_DN907_c0_g1~~TRINITY_DN907_c0_g1_i1.p1  ORF type:complete len:293 (+),score=46.57 TRINITY_DN907_c0_g1_i1:22-879(+)